MTLQHPLTVHRRLNILLGLLLIVAALMLSVATVFAQDTPPDEPWSIYLSDHTQAHQLNADGSVGTFNLPPGGDNIYGPVAFSPDGSRFASCAMPTPSADPNAPIPPMLLQMYELASQSVVFAVPLQGVSDCSVTPEAISVDGSRLAFGTVAAFAGPETPPPPTLWQLTVADATTGERLAALDALHPGMSAFLDAEERQGMYMPVVRRVEGDLVTFALVPWFTHGQPLYDAYVWNTADQSVVEAPMWGRIFSGDQVLTADGFEFAYTALDESLPAATSEGPVAPQNTVVIQREGGEPQVIYTNTTELITGVTYINNGNALAISLLQGDDAASQNANAYTPTVRYVMITRDGTVTEIIAPQSGVPTEIASLPGGYMTLMSVYDQPTDTQTTTVNAVINGETVNLLSDNLAQWVLLHATPPDLSAVILPEFVPSSES